MVWGRQPITELYFHHFKIVFDNWHLYLYYKYNIIHCSKTLLIVFHKKFKSSKKAECQFASKKNTLDEEIELLRSHIGSLEQEKKAADDENALLKVFFSNFAFKIKKDTPW